jgi:glycosyltransferase involved in cell wall biosynthesis
MTERRRRVAVVAYHYPPSDRVGAQRPARLVGLLREAGVDVEVVAAAATKEAAAEPGLHRVRVSPSPRHFLAAAKRRVRAIIAKPEAELASTESDGHGVATDLGDEPSALKRFLFSILWMPDDLQGFILPAARMVAKLHREQPFDLIYVTAPPFSAHVAGLLASRWTGVPWWMELRDPWWEGKLSMDNVRSAPMDWVEQWLERKCLRSAQTVITVTESVAEIERGKLPETQQHKVMVSLNGIPRLSLSPDIPTSGVPTLIHAGTLYLERDPRPLFRGIRRLRERGGLGTGSLRLLFLGDGRWFGGESVEKMVRDFGIDDLVSFQDAVPRAEADRLISEASVLLLLAQNFARQLPQKLFDYLGTRKPILALIDAEGESARILRKVGGHFVVPVEATDDDCADAIAASLAKAREQKAIGTQDVLADISATRQLGLIVARVLASDQRR